MYWVNFYGGQKPFQDIGVRDFSQGGRPFKEGLAKVDKVGQGGQKTLILGGRPFWMVDKGVAQSSFLKWYL